LIDPTGHFDALACGKQLPCVNRSKSWMKHRFPDVSGITTLSGVTQVYGTNARQIVEMCLPAAAVNRREQTAIVVKFKFPAQYKKIDHK